MQNLNWAVVYIWEQGLADQNQKLPIGSLGIVPMGLTVREGI